MHKLQLPIQIMFVAIIGFILTPLLKAQIHDVTVTVKGMACPFCAFGVEKKLKKIDGVATITIKLEEGTVILKAKQGESIDVIQIPKAIKDAGFTSGTMRITARGYIRVDSQKRLSLQIDKSAQFLLLVDIKNTLKEQLLSRAASGVTVKISGNIRLKFDGSLTLSPQMVEEISI